MIELIDKHKTWLMVEDIKNRNPDMKTILREVQSGIKTMPSIESEPQWIPFTENTLPKKGQKIIFTEICRVAEREPYVGKGQYHFKYSNGKYCVSGRCWHIDDSDIVAYFPLPEPYQSESEG